PAGSGSQPEPAGLGRWPRSGRAPAALPGPGHSERPGLRPHRALPHPRGVPSEVPVPVLQPPGPGGAAAAPEDDPGPEPEEPGGGIGHRRGQRWGHRQGRGRGHRGHWPPWGHWGHRQGRGPIPAAGRLCPLPPLAGREPPEGRGHRRAGT
ncbi:unnamed protein product, partial [Coccothraustes coccothraustes]